jgi:hypothetical protein
MNFKAIHRINISVRWPSEISLSLFSLDQRLPQSLFRTTCQTTFVTLDKTERWTTYKIRWYQDVAKSDLTCKNLSDSCGSESDSIWFFSKNQTDLNSTRSNPRWSKIRDDLRSDYPKSDLTRTRTTQNPRKLEIRPLKIWPDPNTNNPKLKMTRDQSTRNPTQPDFKRFKYNWTTIMYCIFISCIIF